MKKTKLLLTLGSLALGFIPVFTIVSCGKLNAKSKITTFQRSTTTLYPSSARTLHPFTTTSQPKINFLTNDIQIALDAINQNALKILGNSGAGTIAQATLDALATSDLANVTISANQMTNIANGDTITLIAMPRPGYAFSDGESSLTHSITISGLTLIITTSDAQNALDAINQNALKILGNSGAGIITQATLDALATGDLSNVAISANKMINITNGNMIFLNIAPKLGYIFSGSESNLFHPITISGLTMAIATSDAQSKLDAINQVALNISDNNGVGGTITQATLDALATGDLANVTISASKMNGISETDVITLTATPKPGYTFSDGEKNLTHQIIINESIVITNIDAQSILDTLDQSALKILGNSGSGIITQETLDALARGILSNVIISANKMDHIVNGDIITLTAIPKPGYAFSGDGSNLTHQIIIGQMVAEIDTHDAQNALDAIVQNALKISGNFGLGGTIFQTTLDDLAKGGLANVNISADKMTNIGKNDVITLIATPKLGYVFSGNHISVTHQIIISELPITITTNDAQNALDAIDQSALNILGNDVIGGTINQATLDALEIDNLANTIIVINEVSDIYNNDVITLTATPKPGYTFSDGKSTLTHQITISELAMPLQIDSRDIQSALYAISENNLNITGNDGIGTISQATLDALVVSDDFIRFIYNNSFHEAALDALAPSDFINIINISADKMINIANGDTITLTATPKPGYAFSGGKKFNSLTCQVSISKLEHAIYIPFDNVNSAFNAIDESSLQISGYSRWGTINQTTLDALATGDLANTIIIVDKMTNIKYRDMITLTLKPKPGYSLDYFAKEITITKLDVGENYIPHGLGL